MSTNLSEASSSETNATDSNGKKITIELIYPLPHEQKLFEIHLEPKTIVSDAINLSGILELYPEIDLADNKVGIFGKACKLTDSLHDGDRIEIYRSLIADPKEARKKRALKKK